MWNYSKHKIENHDDPEFLHHTDCIGSSVFIYLCVYKDWDESMYKMHNMLHPPQEKSILAEKIPLITWQKREWALYHESRYNVRVPAAPILQKLQISEEQYKKWVSSLSGVLVQVAFYPLGIHKYTMVDILFESEYHMQVADILGMLPSTCVFFSVGKYLLARLSFSHREEMRELFTFIYEMKEQGFFTGFHSALIADSFPQTPLVF